MPALPSSSWLAGPLEDHADGLQLPGRKALGSAEVVSSVTDPVLRNGTQPAPEGPSTARLEVSDRLKGPQPRLLKHIQGLQTNRQLRRESQPDEGEKPRHLTLEELTKGPGLPPLGASDQILGP